MIVKMTILRLLGSSDDKEKIGFVGVKITGVSDPRGGGVNRVANRFLS